MTNCKEFALDDIMAITAIPIANISASDPGSLANILSPVIASDDFNPSLDSSITIGRQPAAEDEVLIPIVRTSGKAKDDESDGVAGRMHSVGVTCEVDGRSGDIWDPLLALERTPAHLLLSFRGGARGFVSATDDTYMCTVQRDGAKISVSFNVQNLMGVQPIV